MKGYINIDRADNAYDVKPDIECDVRKLPQEDDSVDEILAIHIFEHFYLNEVDNILEEWKRVLKVGGKLIIEVPCMEKVLQWFDAKEVNPQMTFWALYGDPSTHKGEADLHKWCWSSPMLQRVVEGHGFKDIKIMDPEFHMLNRDMRLEAVKPSMLEI